MNERPALAVIYGSNREQRQCDQIATWLETQVDAFGGFARTRIDPVELDLPTRHPVSGSRSVGALRRQIDAAQAFVVVTPEYNHGYTAALKHLIDCADTEWRLKPVAFVSYGGQSGGRHAVEQLRQVFTSLNAITVPETIAFDRPWRRFDATGRLIEPEPWRSASLKLLEQLRDWTGLLHGARSAAAFQPLHL